VERRERAPRPDWQRRVEEAGFPIHTAEGPYWDESAFWVFSPAEVDLLERATAELHEMALAAVGHVLETGRYWERLAIPREMVPLIARSWEGQDGDGDPSIYGRMDLAWDGTSAPRLLEYNADTPTGLVEASVVQWQWLQDVDPGADQWNSLHERLVAGWKELAPWLPVGPLHFASLGVAEDVLTATYLQDTAAQGGLRTSFVEMPAIGWDERKGAFVDAAGEEMRACFKLYPWEWMAREQFGAMLPRAHTRWIEPTWKMVASNKGILAVLWELYPDHPNLLPAFLEPGDLRSYARKPLLSREGANVVLVKDGEVLAEGADEGYGKEGHVWQALWEPEAPLAGKHLSIGSWLVRGVPAGAGIRESDGPITGNLSRFVPHLIAEGDAGDPRRRARFRAIAEGR
jgi:glutathionylspermidine synthase